MAGFVACPSSQTQVTVNKAFAVQESSLFLLTFAEKFPASPRGEVVDVRSSDLK